MLRLGQSTVRSTRGVNATGRNYALLPSSGQQQHGISMRRSLTPAAHRRSNRSSTGGSTAQQGTHGTNSRGSGVCVARKVPSAFSATHLSTPKRLMSTAVGGDNASAAAAAAGDLGPDAMAGAADAAMAAAGAVDQAAVTAAVAPETFKMALYTPPQLAMTAIDSVHAMTGMPYWMTIVAITLGMKTAIVPIGLLAARNGARTAAMTPEMDALQAAIKGDEQSSQPRKAERYRQETKALYKKHGASLLMNAALPVVQLPLFVGFFLGLRRMPDVVPEFATGGALWFKDLGAADPYVVFPVMTGVMMMAMAELGGEGGAMAGSSIKMKAGMRGIALLVAPFTMYIPTGVFVYWTTSNFYSILQTLAFKSPTIKRVFKFPDLPPSKPESSAAEKELGWFDVLGGDNPIKEYRKMQEQREVQAWFGGEGGRAGPTGVVEREGAPFQAPPPLAGPVGGKAKAKAPAFAAAAGGGRLKSRHSQPHAVLHDVRPKALASGNSSNKGNKEKGRVRYDGRGIGVERR